MSPTAQTMPLGIEGFTYADLYAPARLKELYDRFCRDVAAADPDLSDEIDELRRHMAAVSESRRARGLMAQ